MKHDWQDVSAENGILGPLKRRCTNCGAVQERKAQREYFAAYHAWKATPEGEQS